MKGSSWFDIAAPFTIGLFGMAVPSFISLALVILLWRKVVRIRTGLEFSLKKSGSGSVDNHTKAGSSGAGMSNTESHQNNEAIMIITMLSVYHFVIYAPFSLVYTTRGAIGYLFSSNVVTLLAGMI